MSTQHTPDTARTTEHGGDVVPALTPQTGPQALDTASPAVLAVDAATIATAANIATAAYAAEIGMR